jgi:glycosyltransferase involved in cell wall biosynthesis
VKPRPAIAVTFHQPPELLDELINPRIVKPVDRVIVLSPEQLSYFESYMPRHKISMILHGVDTEFFRPESHPKAHSGFRCLSVGSWLRDYEVVLRVAELLRSQRDVEFQIVSSVISSPPHLPNVSVRSGIDDNALRAMYQQADVLFLPVKAATANNSILEGIACGLPVVASDLSSLRTYLPGKEAVLIPRNDPDKFAHALLALYHDPELRREMAVQARRRALELSWSAAAREHETLYRELALQVGQSDIPAEEKCT